MEKILVTKGLNELKLLDRRINRKITEGEFIAAAKLSVPNVNSKISKEGKEKITQDSYDAIAEPYRKANEYGLVDSLDIEKLIKEMKDKIEGFLSEVDTALQISNSTTIIEID